MMSSQEILGQSQFDPILRNKYDNDINLVLQAFQNVVCLFWFQNLVQISIYVTKFKIF